MHFSLLKLQEFTTENALMTKMAVREIWRMCSDVLNADKAPLPRKSPHDSDGDGDSDDEVDLNVRRSMLDNWCRV